MSEWSGWLDTPQTVTATRAPAVLKIPEYEYEYEDAGWQLKWGKPKQDVKQNLKESKIKVLPTKKIVSWLPLKQVTIEAEVVCGGNEDEETKVRFFKFFCWI